MRRQCYPTTRRERIGGIRRARDPRGLWAAGSNRVRLRRSPSSPFDPARSNGPPCDFGGCGGAQPLAGKRVTRLPLRGNGLSYSLPDSAFVVPTGGTRAPHESFDQPSGAAPAGLRTSPVSRRPYSRGLSLPLPPPQAIVGPRPQLKECVDMARPRSVIYAVAGEFRRPGIHLDWVTTTCTRPSCSVAAPR